MEEKSHDDMESLLSKGAKPYTPTFSDKVFAYLKPFLKYVFNLRPVIPNIIYIIISIGGMQLIKAKGFYPDVEWLQTFLFFGLLAGISIQILFASAKSISIPLLVIASSSWAIWAQTTQGVTLPIGKEVFQCMMALGTMGVIISSAFNP
tara:strand:- start:4833 stop:5279 length:447 start_codon:yes stop_codon:yes gene_type:complete